MEQGLIYLLLFRTIIHSPVMQARSAACIFNPLLMHKASLFGAGRVNCLTLRLIFATVARLLVTGSEQSFQLKTGGNSGSQLASCTVS